MAGLQLDPLLVVADKDRAAKYLCGACKKLLVRPLQVSCGHRFCSSCVSELLRKPPARCPADDIPILKSEVFRDIFAEREVAKLQVKCSLVSQDGTRCLWSGALQLLGEHEAKCVFTRVVCSNDGCEEVMLRMDLRDHLRDGCLYRAIPCPHCCMDVAASSHEKHVAECVGGDMQHQLRAASRPFRTFCQRERCVHGENEPCECTVECQFCKSAIRKRSMMEHHCECPQSPTCCPNGCASTELLRQNIDDHLRTCPNQVVDCFYRQYGCTFQGRRHEQPAHEKAQENYHLRIVATQSLEKSKMLAEENRGLSQKVAALEKCLSQQCNSPGDRLEVEPFGDQGSKTAIRLSIQETKVSNGVLLWKISNFKQCRQDALSGKIPTLYSPPFYTSPAGYKVCAWLYPNGDGIGRGTHVSFFFVVMRGEFDALQCWPFQLKVSLILLEQNRCNPHDIVEIFRPDPNSMCCQRPKKEMNVATGCPLFVPLAMLNDPSKSYLRNDTLHLKVLVHPDSPQPPEQPRA